MFKRLLTGVVFAGSFLGLLSGQEGDFFAERYGKSGHPALKDSRKLYPEGRLFLYAGYSGKPARDLDRGFTVAGPVYGDQMPFIKACSELRIPVFAHIGSHSSNGISAIEAAAGLSKADVEKMVHERMVQLTPYSDIIVAWGLVPEEIRPWRKGEVAYLENLAGAVRSSDPMKRPRYLYNPNNRDTASLKMLSPSLELLGKGSYVNPAGYENDRAWVRRNVEMCLAARTSDSQVVLVQPWMAADPEDPKKDALIERWVRHDVYLGLMSGAKGVVIWSLFPRKGFQRTWKIYYDAYARCGMELSGKEKLADVFLFGEARDDLKVEPLDTRNAYVREGGSPLEPLTSSPEELKAKEVLQPWTKAEFAFVCERYLFIANSWREPTRFRIGGIPDNARVLNVRSGQFVNVKSGTLERTLQSWEVVIFKISKTSKASSGK